MISGWHYIIIDFVLSYFFQKPADQRLSQVLHFQVIILITMLLTEFLLYLDSTNYITFPVVNYGP